MSKVDKLLRSIKTFLVKAEEADKAELIDSLPDIPEIEELPALIEEFETITAKLLRRQRKYYLDAIESFLAKDEETLEALLSYFRNDLFVADEFALLFSEEAAKFLTNTTSSLSRIIMDSIDEDVVFEVLSKRTTKWVTDWSEELSNIMELGTHKAIESQLLEAIEAGESIAQVELRLKDMPGFDRNRARATARTEVLTASSQANWESFMQSPSVRAKRWRHSGTRNINARETHLAMDGVEEGVDDLFLVDGEFGMYPRDTTFSPKNRVNCGCVLSPVVDEKIIGLSQEEKEAIRQEVLEELNR